MEPIQKVLKAVLDAHVGDVHLLAVQLKASPASVQRWVQGGSKPRPAYEAQLRKIYEELETSSSVVREDPPLYRVTPHHPMITEAVDSTLRSIREVLHKRGHLSSRSQALDELSKLLFAHVEGQRSGKGGISRQTIGTNSKGLAVLLKQFVDETIYSNLPNSLVHNIDRRDYELRLKPQEDELAAELIECFSTLQRQTSSFNFSGFDILNEVFGKFLSDSFIDEKELGQYLTPPEVVKFMVGLAIQGFSESEMKTICDPKKCADFGLILDPSCGVASFFAEVVHQLKDRVKEKTENPKYHKDWIKTVLEQVIVGIDKSERMVRLAMTNLAMFGFPMARLHLANSLARIGPDGKLTDGLTGKVKLILTNPPFGATFKGNDLARYKIANKWSRKLPGRIDSEILFVERYLDWLAPGGQLIAVVPDSILTNKAVFEDLRRGIADQIELCSVISLPSVTFGIAGTTTKTSILHIRKRQKDKDTSHRTAFAICQDLGFSVATKANQRVKIAQGENDLPRILDEIITPISPPSVVRWLRNADEFERWDAQHHASLTTEVEQRLGQKAKGDICISDIAQLIDERADPRRSGAKEFNYIEISDIDIQTCVVYTNCIETTSAPSRARKIVKAGDVLISTVRPERGAIGVVGPHLDGAVCTTGLAVLRPFGVDSLTLAYLLKTEFVTAQLMRNNVGIAYPAIKESCLPTVLLPVQKADLPKLECLSREIAATEERLHEFRKEFNKSIGDAGSEWRQTPITPDPKPHQESQTTYRRRQNKSGSDSRDQEILQLSADHKA